MYKIEYRISKNAYESTYLSSPYIGKLFLFAMRPGLSKIRHLKVPEIPTLLSFTFLLSSPLDKDVHFIVYRLQFILIPFVCPSILRSFVYSM